MDWKRFSAAISAEWKCPVCFSLASKGQWTGQFQLYYGCSRRLCANIHLFITCSLLIFRSTFCLKRSPRRPLREHMNVCFLCKHKKSLTLNWFCRTGFFFFSAGAFKWHISVRPFLHSNTWPFAGREHIQNWLLPCWQSLWRNSLSFALGQGFLPMVTIFPMFTLAAPALLGIHMIFF